MAGQSEFPFDKAIADTICDLVAEGQNLHRIGKLDGYPPRWRIYEWLRENQAFADNYARAREDRADWRSARLDDISAKLMDGAIDPGAARVLADIEKWQAGKEKPKVYGDRVQAEVTGKDGAAIQLEHTIGHLTIEELKKLATLGAVE